MIIVRGHWNQPLKVNESRLPAACVTVGCIINFRIYPPWKKGSSASPQSTESSLPVYLLCLDVTSHSIATLHSDNHVLVKAPPGAGV